MVVMSGVMHVSAVPVRIATTITSVIVLVSIIAAGIAIGIVIGRQSDSTPFNRVTTVFRSDFNLAIDRLIANYELPEYYNAPATLADLIVSLNEQLKLSYPETSIQLVISTFSGQPILVSTAGRRRRQLNSRPSIITLNGTAYFIQNYTGSELEANFSNYSQLITLRNNYNGGPSSAIGTFSTKYSVFTDTTAIGLTVSQVDALVSITISDTTTTVSTITGAVG